MKCGDNGYLTVKGRPCKRDAMKEGYCRQHGPDPAHQPLKLTSALTQDVCKALASGCSVRDAAAYCEIGASTFYRWMETGEADKEGGIDSAFCELWDGVHQARAKGKIRNLAMINGDPDWRARAWVLERTFPDEFGRRDRVDVNVPVPASLDMAALSDDDLAELERIVDLAGGAGSG